MCVFHHDLLFILENKRSFLPVYSRVRGPISIRAKVALRSARPQLTDGTHMPESKKATCWLVVLLNHEFYDLGIIRWPCAHLVTGVAK